MRGLGGVIVIGILLALNLPTAYEFLSEMIFEKRVFALADKLYYDIPYSEKVNIAYWRVKNGRFSGGSRDASSNLRSCSRKHYS